MHILETQFNKKIALDPNNTEFKDPIPNHVRDLRGFILAKVDRYVGEHTTPNTLAENNHFEVICDDKIKVADNTVAGKALLDERSHQVSKERSNWWVIPRDVLGLEN